MLALLGASFAVSPIPLAVAVQLWVPHTCPEGQQPPPVSAPHMNQPFAQEPAFTALAALAALVVAVPGTTTVTPVPTTEVLSEEGQEVVSQFLPTRQHPPR